MRRLLLQMGVAFALATLSGLPLAGQDFTAVEQ